MEQFEKVRSGADDGSAGFWFGTRGVDFERGPRSRARTHFWHFEIHTHILPDQRPAPMPAVLVVLVAGLAVAGMISKWSVSCLATVKLALPDSTPFRTQLQSLPDCRVWGDLLG